MMIKTKVKAVVFGVGNYWNTIKLFLDEQLEVVACMDNNAQKQRGGIYQPKQWRELNFDKIVICVADYRVKLQMMNQLLDLGVEKERIGFIESFLQNNNIQITVAETGIVNICSGNVVIRCENEIEYMIAYEIFGEEEYGFHTNENYFCIDIGMNIGSATLYFASQENVTAVYGFEPCKGVYEKAVSNISINSKEIQEKIHTYNVGLSARDGIENYIAHDGIGESAGIKKVQDGTEYSENNIEIKTRQASHMLANIFENHSESCLLKMDCEGAEYEILDDLINSGVIKRVDVIIMEWHVGKYRQLEELLKRAGFKYVLNKGSRDFGKCYAWK